ncbi:MAG: ABC transporter permease [Candidatus Heimdallarchaeota archaeon]|nr:ABC transporter permease [Candidatus Heimdallarchaeota archaeon]
MAIQNVKITFQNSFRVLGKSIWRDLVNIRRYRMRLIGWLLNMMIGLGAAYIFGVVLNFNEITTSGTGILSTQVFVFFAGGIALSTFSDTATWAPMGRVTQDIHYGTLEAVFVTPTSRLAYLLAPTLSDSILNLLFFIPAYTIILGVHGALTNIYIIGTTLLIVFLTICSMIAFGLFFAMLAILIRRIDPIAIFLNNIFQFICGAFVPVQAYIGMSKYGGQILKYIAHIFPYTYCYDLFRYYMFSPGYVTLLPIWLEYVLLIVSSLLFIILAFFLLKRVEKKAKKTGLSIL